MTVNNLLVILPGVQKLLLFGGFFAGVSECLLNALAGGLHENYPPLPKNPNKKSAND